MERRTTTINKDARMSIKRGDFEVVQAHQRNLAIRVLHGIFGVWYCGPCRRVRKLEQEGREGAVNIRLAKYAKREPKN